MERNGHKIWVIGNERSRSGSMGGAGWVESRCWRKAAIFPLMYSFKKIIKYFNRHG